LFNIFIKTDIGNKHIPNKGIVIIKIQIRLGINNTVKGENK